VAPALSVASAQGNRFVFFHFSSLDALGLEILLKLSEAINLTRVCAMHRRTK